jgi:hypothetical protein
MLKAYIDESGQETSGWTFVAGFIGTEEQWQEFTPRWNSALAPRKVLHMTDLRWKKDRTRELLARLGPIPEQCGLTGVMGGVRSDDYKDLIAGTPDERLLRGYIAGLLPMVVQILRGTPSDEHIELIFEKQMKYEPLVDMALPAALFLDHPKHPWKYSGDGKPRLKKWSFIPKGNSRLGPADYLAYALRETWTNKESKRSEWCRPILRSGSGEGLGIIIDRAMIRRMICGSQWLFRQQFPDSK